MVDLREVCDFAQTIREKGVEAETMPIVAKASGYAAPTSTGFYRRIVAARLFQLILPQGATLTPLALDYFKPESDDAKSRALKQAVKSVTSYQPLLEKYLGKKLVVANIENAIARSSDLNDDCALLCAKSFVQSLRFAGELDGDDVLLLVCKSSRTCGNTATDHSKCNHTTTSNKRRSGNVLLNTRRESPAPCCCSSARWGHGSGTEEDSGLAVVPASYYRNGLD